MDRLIALVVLRWRIDLRALSRAREALLGLVLMVPGLILFSGVTSLIAYLGVRSLERSYPEALLPLLSAAATGAGLFWAFSPVLTGVAFSESHDMSRLLHFPIPLGTLVASSLIANLLQPLVLAELPILLALALALSQRAGLLPLAAAGVVLSFVFILAAAQVIGLVLQGLSRNRRFQDVASFLGLGLGFVLSLAPLLLMAGGARPIGRAASFLMTVDVFAASPFAWGARAAVSGGRGELVPFALYSAAGLLAIAAAMLASTLLIHRIHRAEVVAGWSADGTAAPARMPLPGVLGALLEKDFRTVWRDPALKASLLMGLAGPLLFLFFISQGHGLGRSGRAILLMALFVGLTAFGANAFGLERRGIMLLLGFSVPRWQILVGKNLSMLLLRAPGLLLLLLAAVFLAPVSFVPAAGTIVVVTFLVVAGVDNFLSILFPVTAPGPGRNPYGPASGGRGLGAALVSAMMLAGALLLASPFVFLAWLPPLLETPRLWWISLPLSLTGAVAVYTMMVGMAARLLARREPDLMERILGEA